MNRKVVFALLLLVGLGSAALAFRSRPYGTNPICRPPVATASSPAPAVVRVIAEGRVSARPGAEVVVGTDTAGTLVRLLVNEKDRVVKGQLIAQIDASVDERSLEQARARVTEAAADLRLAEADRDRAAHLLATQVGSQQALDKAERDQGAASARQATAVADVRRLEAVIRKASITAPISGVVTARHAEQGETVERGARLVTVADLSRIRIEAEVDEADSGRVRRGAEVTVRAEGDGGVWAGTIEEVPDQVTPRKLKPQDPARPSDTRVLLVKIAVADTKGLRLGRRVDVEIAGGLEAHAAVSGNGTSQSAARSTTSPLTKPETTSR